MPISLQKIRQLQAQYMATLNPSHATMTEQEAATKAQVFGHIGNNGPSTLPQIMASVERMPRHWYGNSLYNDVDYFLRELIAEKQITLVGYRAGYSVYALTEERDDDDERQCSGCGGPVDSSNDCLDCGRNQD